MSGIQPVVSLRSAGNTVQFHASRRGGLCAVANPAKRIWLRVFNPSAEVLRFTVWGDSEKFFSGYVNPGQTFRLPPELPIVVGSLLRLEVIFEIAIRFTLHVGSQEVLARFGHIADRADRLDREARQGKERQRQQAQPHHDLIGELELEVRPEPESEEDWAPPALQF